jgi:acetolactate synthase regulatory subunit
MIAATQIIFVGMHNDRATPQILDANAVEHMGEAKPTAVLGHLHIPQIPRVFFGVVRTAMVGRGTYMVVLAGPCTSLTSEISRLVDVESVLAHRQMGEFHDDFNTLGTDLGTNNGAIDTITVVSKDSDRQGVLRVLLRVLRPMTSRHTGFHVL